MKFYLLFSLLISSLWISSTLANWALRELKQSKCKIIPCTEGNMVYPGSEKRLMNFQMGVKTNFAFALVYFSKFCDWLAELASTHSRKQ